MRHANKVLAVLVVTILLLASYVTGYFWLCEFRIDGWESTGYNPRRDYRRRIYRNDSVAIAFTPLTYIEGLLIGKCVCTRGQHEPLLRFGKQGSDDSL